MDNSNASSGGQNDVAQVVQPVQPQVVQVPPVVQQSVPSVGSVHKEAGPVTEVATQEVMQKAGEQVEPEITPEVKEAGVEAVKEVPDLTIHDKKAGIELAKESISHPTAPSGAVTYPMTEEEAKIAVKHKNPRSAWYWTAVAVLRQIHRKLTRIQ